MSDSHPVLYILMRTDLDSMNPGKAMAQASHASNAFVHHANVLAERAASGASMTYDDQETLDLVEEWKNSTNQGFGTVLVLGVNSNEMYRTVMLAADMGYLAELVVDPTYPYSLINEYANLIPESTDTLPRFRKNGETVMFREERTCAYIFMDKADQDGQKLISKFDLHP